jgi:hypothetical protein
MALTSRLQMMEYPNSSRTLPILQIVVRYVASRAAIRFRTFMAAELQVAM